VKKDHKYLSLLSGRFNNLKVAEKRIEQQLSPETQ